ncbi:hypothetical protein BT63DRAFT_94630 [Microthyrium microscopicum]|uniref:Uncharacterized protein n=1 Tax=Microthyrium microscopicum TaxID=703497 RepID=A0A6A6U0L1_9PEZI|nr:hypothetical protein BT63DRAFT_94630 [Microthyrium microscopicum]
MFPTRRQPSHTLPRNFTFHYADTDGDFPITPVNLEPTTRSRSRSPPEAPRQAGPYRLRRRREARPIPTSYLSLPNSHDVPIPTIEISDHIQASEIQPLSVQPIRPRGSPPKTPIPQVQDIEADQDTNMEQTDACSQGESISRPSTACSGFSDSSVSSSIESFPSLGESFTSPESEVFLDNNTGEISLGKQTTLLPSFNPYFPQASTGQSKPLTKPKGPWTEEMDNHLWMTYMRYIQDPVHTPFKMLPGTAPPLGVCSRVVREAKRTWKGPRSTSYRLVPWGQRLRGDSPDTIKPAHSGSSTPTEAPASKRLPWTRSDGSTRKRLRELCKRKPTLSAHYSRLLATRSPSPFLSSSDRSSSAMRDVNPHASFNQSSAFATRDMSLSLFSSTSTAVNAMNQMTAESVTPKPLDAGPFQPPPSSRMGAHQKSQSLQLNLGIGESSARSTGILASPFQPLQKPQLSDQHANLQTSTKQLASPLQLAAPVPQSRIRLQGQLGRDAKAQLNAEAPAELFPGLGPRFGGIAQRRGRSRAVSMGDASASSRRLSLLFEPPTNNSVHQVEPQMPPATIGVPSSLMPPPTFGPVRRLGSPFSEKPSRPHFNTFPRNFGLHSLEPTIESHEERAAPPESSDSQFSGPDSHAPLV